MPSRVAMLNQASETRNGRASGGNLAISLRWVKPIACPFSTVPWHARRLRPETRIRRRNAERAARSRLRAARSASRVGPCSVTSGPELTVCAVPPRYGHAARLPRSGDRVQQGDRSPLLGSFAFSHAALSHFARAHQPHERNAHGVRLGHAPRQSFVARVETSSQLVLAQASHDSFGIVSLFRMHR